MFLGKFKKQTFKNFIARHQVNYLWENYKPTGKTTRIVGGRLQDINNYFEHFLGPDSTVTLTKGDSININIRF